MSSSMSSSTVVDPSGVRLCPLAQRAEVVTPVSMDLSESGFGGSSQRALIGQMHQQLDELLGARDKTEHLLRSIINIGSDLDLDATLHQIVTAAMELTGARYGALAVHGTDGAWTHFVHAGMDPETIRRIGHFPVGKGVFGVPLDQTPALRLNDLTAHPAAVGFPEHHPPMRAFLAVPIMIRGTVVASLYLTDDRPSRAFAVSDEVAARRLAAAAGVAINNAQLFDHTRASAEWTDASREIITALLSGIDPHLRPLQLIAEQVRKLTDAEQAIVLVSSEADLPADEVDTLIVSAAVGLRADEVIGQRVPMEGSTTGGVFRSGTPLITEAFRYPIQAFTDIGERPAIVMPLRADGTVLGVIAVARNEGQQPFDASYLELVSDFAGHAAIALTLASAREHARALSILADRERIAHDLHDQVIQRLFAIGMDLQGTIARAHSPEVIDRLNRTVDDLQATIEDIRTTIFQLQSPTERDGGFRRRMQNLIADLTQNRNIVTSLQMSGPMTAVGPELAQHAEAVVAEAVSNAVRHSGATRLTIEVTAADELSIDVRDNGHGIPAENQRQSGLANMRRRAEHVGGKCSFTSPPEGGTVVHWIAPLIDF
jgi:signal transduction histidine kinase